MVAIANMKIKFAAVLEISGGNKIVVKFFFKHRKKGKFLHLILFVFLVVSTLPIVDSFSETP